MQATVESGGQEGDFPKPMALGHGSAPVRILLIDDDKNQLDALSAALAAPHRTITPIQANDVKTAMDSFTGQDIVIVDRDLNPKAGWEGVEITSQIKQAKPETIVVINSAFPPAMHGRQACAADYTHTKGLGGIIARGEIKSLLDVKNPAKGYENLAELVGTIERERLKHRQ
jgi:CheY-like chemotaxis protein